MEHSKQRRLCCRTNLFFCKFLFLNHSLAVTEAGGFQEFRRKTAQQECQRKCVLMFPGMKLRSRQSIPESEVRQVASADREWLKPHKWEQIPGRKWREKSPRKEPLEIFWACLIWCLELSKRIRSPLKDSSDLSGVMKTPVHTHFYLCNSENIVMFLNHTAAFYSLCIFTVNKENGRSWA